MAAINPYLIFDGNCEKAFLFYQSVFGGEFPFMGRYSDMPPMDGKTIDPAYSERIMHVSLPISAETVLMGSDNSSEAPDGVVFGNNVSISVNANSKDEADKIFNGLVSGGTLKLEMHQAFWGAYFGMLLDQFGIHWMVNFDAAEPMGK